MNLRQFEGKNVRLTDKGYVSDYIFAEDNAPEEVEALILENLIRKSDGYKYENPVEFTALEIQSVEIL